MPENHKLEITKVALILMLWAILSLPLLAFSQTEAATQKRLMVGTLIAPPFAMKAPGGRWEGLSIDLWQAIASDLGVTYELREYGAIGQIVDEAVRGILDVVIVASVNEKYEIILDLSHSYLRSGSGIAVPFQGSGRGWFRFVQHVASLDLLKLIGLLILLWLMAGGVVWLLERRRNREMFGGSLMKGFGQGVWWAAVTMTTVGYGDKAPKTLSGRIMAILWMLISIILISGYTAAVTTSLTVGELKGKVRGFGDLPDVRVGSVAQSESMNFLMAHGISVLPFQNEKDGLQAIIEKRIDAFVYDESVLRYVVKNEFPSRVNVLEGTFNHYYVSMAMPTGSPLRENINRALLRVLNSEDWPRLTKRYLGYQG